MKVIYYYIYDVVGGLLSWNHINTSALFYALKVTIVYNISPWKVIVYKQQAITISS